VGIVVEVVDIEDLTNYLADTTNTDLTTTFTKLLTDSEKHLSAFTKTLEKYDQTLAEEEVSEWLTNAIEEFDTVTPVNLINATSRNDIITGTESLSDTLSYQSGATKGVVVNLGLTYAQNTFGSGRDSITGIENLIGSEFNDTLRGDKNNNQLSGETGNDILVGGLGVDQLTGGAGRDKFVLTQAKDSGITFESMDTITDFVTGQDKIDLSIMDANTAMKGNNAFTGFIDATSTFTTAGQVKFDNGILYGNTDKDADAEFAIALTGITTLSVTDLIL
jgi:Ca2+-binding RTX toxin-like protein